ncbi:hypothetical protein QI038_11210 [Staphylococcus saprophyticus]|nr:hypothetical protein [Staphylococcus saprophyticus]
MVKIKQKKQLNLPQLIEWLLKSGYRNYTANSNMGNIVTLSRYGAIQFSLGTFFPEETFTIEVEEEITKDTKLPSVLVYDGKYFNALYGLSINDIEKRFIDYVYGVETIHLINGDTHTLIWRDGKLVE